MWVLHCHFSSNHSSSRPLWFVLPREDDTWLWVISHPIKRAYKWYTVNFNLVALQKVDEILQSNPRKSLHIACEDLGMNHANILQWTKEKQKLEAIKDMCTNFILWVITPGAHRNRAPSIYFWKKRECITSEACHNLTSRRKIEFLFCMQRMEYTIFCCAEICQILWLCAQVGYKSLMKRSL